MKRQRSYTKLDTVKEESPERPQDQHFLMSTKKRTRRITSGVSQAKTSCCLILLVVVLCEGLYKIFGLNSDGMLGAFLTHYWDSAYILILRTGV